MTGKGTLRGAAAGWLSVALVIAIQWQLFSRFVTREIAWAYPAYFDQVATLARTYETCEHVKIEGYLAGLRYGLGRSGASSTLFPLQAALLCRALGPSRQSALDLNFLYVAALQATLVATLLWLTRRWSFAFLGLGLLLTANSPFLPVGGLADLRMDMAAASLMGIFLCLSIRSRAFAERRFALAAGATACLLVGVRTLTLVYFVGILAGFACLALWRTHRSRGNADAWRQRLAGLKAASLVLGALTVPLIWIQWRLIRDYYVVGHVTGPDKWFYSASLGIRTIGDFILYYPRSFMVDHAGPSFLWAAGCVLVMVGLVSRMSPRSQASADWAPAVLLSGLTFGVPLAALTADVAKSPVVAGIVVTPAVWLVLLAAMRLAAAESGSLESGPWKQRVLAGLAAGVLALGLVTQWRGFGREGPFAHRRQEVQAARALHAAIGASSHTMGWSEPLITVDRLADSIVPSIVTTEMYERHAILVKVRFGVWGIGSVSEEQALASVARSDFVMLTTSEGSQDTFPFDASMRALHPKLVQACAEDHVVLGQFRLEGLDVTAYVRAALKLEETDPGPAGVGSFVLTGLGAVIAARPMVELAGATGTSAAPHGVSATLETSDGGAPQAVAATLESAAGAYRIRLELPSTASPGTAPVRVRVELHGGRFLAPQRVELRARPAEVS
jgi:hypothetical protein